LFVLLCRCVAGPEMYYVTIEKQIEKNGIKQQQERKKRVIKRYGGR
jgi:hypothetical protein